MSGLLCTLIPSTKAAVLPAVGVLVLAPLFSRVGAAPTRTMTTPAAPFSQVAARAALVAARLGGFIAAVARDVALGRVEVNLKKRARQLTVVLSGLGCAARRAVLRCAVNKALCACRQRIGCCTGRLASRGRLPHAP